MISLAPFRYARVLKKDDGPIEKIKYGRITNEYYSLYQAQAYLSKHLNLQKAHSQVFGQADGTGTHKSAMVARHMAISEAIERWALYYLRQSGMQKLYGFHIDETSNGMSAYPGLFAIQARRRALLEAIERFCLIGWWSGKLGGDPFRMEQADIDALQIDNPLSNDSVVILWKRDPGGFHTYGYGAGTDLKQANNKALVELERTLSALRAFHHKNPGFEEDDLETLGHSLERRVVYFSMPEGFRRFRSRLERTTKPVGKLNLAPLVDSEVKGPWSKYATVWRVLYPMPSTEYLSADHRWFFW